MFSGIVEARGTVVDVRSEPPGCRIIVRAPAIAAEIHVADSVSINGCCLTVVEVAGDAMSFQAGPETLARTNLGELQPGSPVNLERALAVNGRLGGHFVSGHIDGVATLAAREDHGEWSTFRFKISKDLGKQMASKGSVAVDGVSLTIVDSEPESFSVALIPFTLDVTTLGPMKVGDKANIETDMLAKYVGRLFESQQWDQVEVPVKAPRPKRASKPAAKKPTRSAKPAAAKAKAKRPAGKTKPAKAKGKPKSR